MDIPTVDELYDALETASICLRWERPDIYEIVDSILANPNRHGQNLQEFDTIHMMNECPRCGDFTSNPVYCNKECCDEHEAFLSIRRRGFPECKWCGEPLLGQRTKYCNPKHQAAHRVFNFKRKLKGLKPT